MFRSSSAIRVFSAAIAAVALFGLVFARSSKESAEPQSGAAGNRYIGANKCKNCHEAEASGNQYAVWLKSGHSKAFETLGSDEAKKFAKEKGIDDPQKSDKCLKCHETAFGVAADLIKNGFDPKQGVQCESCHGPGEAHFKARFSAAASGSAGDGLADDKAKASPQTVPAGKILTKIEQKTCLGCHNDGSPTFKPFCFYERRAKIAHFDPRRTHTKEELLVCGCEKCTCVHGSDPGCGVDPKSKK
jgi:Cytochrome c554 and c-prime